MPEWAIDGLLNLIADILQNERSGYSRQWTEAQSARKNAILAELDIVLQFMRGRKDCHSEFAAQLSRALKRQFPHFDGQLSRNREEDRLIAGELVLKKSRMGPIPKKYIAKLKKSRGKLPNPRTMGEIEARTKLIKSAKIRTRQSD